MSIDLNKIKNRIVYLIKANYKTIFLWILIIVFIKVAFHFHIYKSVITAVVLVFGIVGHAFTGLLGLISYIPVIGPMIVHIISLPLFFLINGITYIATVLFLRRKGGKKDIVISRSLTNALLIGTIIGFILGKLF